jgi:ferric-dicitrate binding protein FerR (iron transport regulator)
MRTARRSLTAILSASILALAPAPARAQGTPVGAAQTAIGLLVVVRTDGVEQRLQGKGNLPLFDGDTLRTEAGGQGLLQLRDGIQVALNEQTQVLLLSRWEKVKGSTRILRVRAGEIWVATGAGPKPLEVETPVATAVVEGTEFNLKVQPDGQSVLTVIEGVVQFGTPFGTCPIRAGTISYGEKGKRCTRPAPTEAKQATEWKAAVTK